MESGTEGLPQEDGGLGAQHVQSVHLDTGTMFPNGLRLHRSLYQVGSN